MTVAIVILSSIAILWIFGSKDFALSMTLFWVMFGLLEVIHLAITHKTISQNFKVWAETQDQ
jgi:hypothetical protein